MNEETIRPEHLMVENAKLHNEDIAKILFHQDAFVKIPCPACKSEKYDFKFEKSYFTFVECNHCETIFVNPRPSQHLLETFYAEAKFIKHWNDKIFPASEKTRRDHIFLPRAKKIAELCKKHQVETNILMDVGAGFGTFCEEMQKIAMFETIIAIEPSPDLAATCRSKNINVIENPIEKVELNNANVITNFELIEHLYSPKDFISACHRTLSPAGLLILTTPNMKGFDLLILEQLSENVMGPEHLNYFNPKSLTYLLEDCGFEIVEIFTPGKLDAELVRKKVLSKELDVSKRPFLKHILVDEWNKYGQTFQNFLAQNMLSSHLWVVARKKYN